MRTRPTVLYFAPAERPAPDLISKWASGNGFQLVHYATRDHIEMAAQRSLPALIVVAAESGAEGQTLCRDLKRDPYTGIIPVAVFTNQHAADHSGVWFEAGADEVITPIFEPAEQRNRLDVLLKRMQTSVSVHPSTRLGGTTEIEREIRRRLELGEEFAVCYADLDHFKEFNDRYSYNDGDRVIFILSRMLRDVVKGVCGADGFVGHIGGDDFILILPTDRVGETCGEIVSVFDTLIPYQYTEQDRRAGYFFGKDRRGQLYRVPLMTLSIGIVTNERRHFTHPAQVSGLATEMKSYAKTLPGSVFVVDRRQDGDNRS
ncbi:MAG TPA: diguanylate cyclase [Gemmatimonadales bacterium]|nr:diguanylate cyclase [Gemmatimonadales bacterium]